MGLKNIRTVFTLQERRGHRRREMGRSHLIRYWRIFYPGAPRGNGRNVGNLIYTDWSMGSAVLRAVPTASSPTHPNTKL